jgi:hypothetical protein
MPNFPIEKLKAAHDLWFKHNSRCNARGDRELKVLAMANQIPVNDDDGPFDYTDIEELFTKQGKGPHLVEIDWKPVTKRPIYTMHQGKKRKTWEWKHNLTGKMVVRHLHQNQKTWDTSKLYQYGSSELKRRDHPQAYDRYHYIRRISGLKGENTAKDKVNEVKKHPRHVLLLQQIKSVMFAIEANSSVASLQGPLAKRFFQELDPMTKPPQRIVFMRIVRLLEEAVIREYKRIVNDSAVLLEKDFCCSNSDFYTNPERRETFGCIVSNMQACRYHLKVSHILLIPFNAKFLSQLWFLVFFTQDGRQMFLSSASIRELDTNVLLLPSHYMDDLEYCVKFEAFSMKKLV